MKTDTEIETAIARLAQGDRSALRPLWKALAPQVLGICTAILQDDLAARAALEQVFIKIWHNADGLAQSGYPPRVWVCTIARNHALDLIRAAQAEGVPEPEPRKDVAWPEGRIGDALALLPTGHGQLIARAYAYGEGYGTLAQRMGRMPDLMPMLLRKSLSALREALTT